MRLTLIAALLGLRSLGGCASAPDAIGTAASPDAYAALASDDLTLASATLQRALQASPDGTVVSWRNEVSGHSGSIKPLRTYVAGNGYFCRTYDEELRTGRDPDVLRRDACRNEAGLWIWS